MKNLDWYMSYALEEAEKAFNCDEVPVGCIVVDSQGKIISRAHNLKESQSNPCGHAEILALTQAGEKLKNWRLLNCWVFVSLEPCPMCLAAMIQARIHQLVFGAYDLKGGSLSLGYAIHRDERLNHQFKVMGGVKHFESSKILSQFFKFKRSVYRSKKY